jgi:hypothetical protein
VTLSFNNSPSIWTEEELGFAKYYYEQGHLAGDQDAAQYAALRF